MTHRRALWQGPRRRVEAWRRLGCSDYICRAIQFGVYELPVRPFVQGEGVELGDIPQGLEDRAFARKDLMDGCKNGIYEEVNRKEVEDALREGAVISSAFTVWQEKGAERKGRLVINFSRQSKHWPKGSMRMESMTEFAMQVEEGDYFVSMDVEKGYRHLRLHPSMRKWFLFRYAGRYYRCVALPFGWGRSPLWFTQFISTFVPEVRRWGYRVLPYVDDFLIAPSPAGTSSTLSDCESATGRIDTLLKELGLKRKEGKGTWTGTQRLEHLGVVVDSLRMRFSVTEEKAKRVRSMAKFLLRDVRLSRRKARCALLRTFCGTCVSLSLAMPWARFYTRALYWDLSGPREMDDRGRVRLSHQSVRDLRFWARLALDEHAERPIRKRAPQASLHSDAADMGYGGTLNTEDTTAGAAGMWVEQGVWKAQERAGHITLRELKEIRKLLMGNLGQKVRDGGVKELLIHVDNSAVVHITNSFVSASRTMMRELRKLKVVLDRLGLQMWSEWLPSAMNRYADALSRRFPRGDLRIRRSVRHSILDGIPNGRYAFRYWPLGEPPVAARKQAFAELGAKWTKDEVRLLCPPLDLALATVEKLMRTKSPAVLLVPHWPGQSWYQMAAAMAGTTRILDAPGTQVWQGLRKVNDAWRLAYLEVNM